MKQLNGGEGFPEVRLIVLGGEAVTSHDIELYRRHFSRSCLLHVGLGTTETNVVRRYFVDHSLPISSAAVPVGYPVDDVEVAVVDAAGSAVVPGEIGEILIKSRFLALGYWRRPDLTDAAFRRDPVNTDDLMYLSGDLGRMASDGCLEHCGRKDFQVKIRGQRIELAEIEQAIMSCGVFRDAVVVAQTGEKDGQRLVAYVVVSTPDVHVDAQELSRKLAERLPRVMIPSAFFVVHELPVTATGKVDRRALAASSAIAAKRIGLEPTAREMPDGSSLVTTLAQLGSEFSATGRRAPMTTFSSWGAIRFSPWSLARQSRRDWAASCRGRRFSRLRPLRGWQSC